MSFSVLMTVYAGDEAVYFNDAIQSIISSQSIVPDDVVLVVDGPVGEKLKGCIQAMESSSVRIFWLDQNVGLGEALAFGLSKCKHSLVARMDSDDISLPKRFELQLAKFLEDPMLSVVGGHIEEFSGKPGTGVLQKREVPLLHNGIARRARFRNPMNHMTVMFRKEDVMAAGGYKSMFYYEDYFLWLRMIKKGFKLANLDETLVFARAGAEMIGRRRGLVNARNEFLFYCRVWQERLLPLSVVLTFSGIRMVTRIMPSTFFKLIYSRLLRRRSL